MTDVIWVTHPRHLPSPSAGTAVVVDVAFAAANQFKTKTLPFIESLGERLVRWIDHHEHRTFWPDFRDDPRFILVPNKIAHACPELITPEVVGDAGGPVDQIFAHCDFDGAVSAAKWLLEGRAPWPEADEDARAIDSPGRGHSLTPYGQRLSWAMDAAATHHNRKGRLDFMTRVVLGWSRGSMGSELDAEIVHLSRDGREKEIRADALVDHLGLMEHPGLFVVRLPAKQDNHMRRNLLLSAEKRAPVGVLLEPEHAEGGWMTAATFDERIDLEEVEGFGGGRSDYRFARYKKDGRPKLEALSRYVCRQLDLHSDQE